MFKEELLEDSVYVSIRPEHISISRDSSATILEGTVREKIFIGTSHKVVVTLASGKDIVVLAPAQLDSFIEDGSHVYLSWNKEYVSILAS